jgi:hypothetical protein
MYDGASHAVLQLRGNLTYWVYFVYVIYAVIVSCWATCSS